MMAVQESSSGKKKHDFEAEDLVIDEALSKHVQPLPKEIRQQVRVLALRPTKYCIRKGLEAIKRIGA